MLPTLETQGAVLRPLELSDAEALFAAHGDARTHHYWSGPAHANVEQTRAYIAETIAMPAERREQIGRHGSDIPLLVPDVLRLESMQTQVR